MAVLRKNQHQFSGFSLVAHTGAKRRDEKSGQEGDETLDVKVKPRQKLKKPNLYRVLLLNDDYTTTDFVVYVLERFFNKNREEATRIMLNVHRNGLGECGIFTYEVAEAKITQVLAYARQHEYPLQCVMEQK